MALGFLKNIVAPKKKVRKGGTALTPTYDPNSTDQTLTVPTYREHLTDLFTSRQANDSRTLLKELFRSDPDVSAALNAYLTMANTDPVIYVEDLDGNIDREATKQLQLGIKQIEHSTDYTLGFQLKSSLSAIAEDLRYMCLLRGAIGAELILNDQLLPSNIRHVDMATVEWYEKKPGEYKPIQKPSGSDEEINLDVPTFFVSFFRKDPTSIYGHSSFVAAINTIAARQQVINDLYRIMRLTGFPRMDIKVVEEVLAKNAPQTIRSDQEKMKPWLRDRLNEVRASFENLRADQAVVHYDSVEIGMVNDRMPGMSVDVTAVIETLNAQNQAGLKTMATVIGRGQAGVNTGSVEARIAAMNADELNEPVAEILTNLFSVMIHLQGYQGFARVKFRKAELRPELELEPQQTLRAARLRQDLSDGLITDDEYHLWMYGRLRPDASPEVSGTGFAAPAPAAGSAEDVTPNDDPLGRSLAPEGRKMTKSNGVN